MDPGVCGIEEIVDIGVPGRLAVDACEPVSWFMSSISTLAVLNRCFRIGGSTISFRFPILGKLLPTLNCWARLRRGSMSRSHEPGGWQRVEGITEGAFDLAGTKHDRGDGKSEGQKMRQEAGWEQKRGEWHVRWIEAEGANMRQCI